MLNADRAPPGLQSLGRDTGPTENQGSEAKISSLCLPHSVAVQRCPCPPALPKRDQAGLLLES